MMAPPSRTPGAAPPRPSKTRRPRQHGVAHGIGNTCRTTGQGLRHKEGIAPCDEIEVSRGVVWRLTRQPRDGLLGEQWEPEPTRQPGGQIAEHGHELVARAHFVIAVAKDKER